tara:strand:+ start:45847 stop:46080 length:234 start_codon:yes stop_codon:yes gene_type:complete
MIKGKTIPCKKLVYCGYSYIPMLSITILTIFIIYIITAPVIIYRMVILNLAKKESIKEVNKIMMLIELQPSIILAKN